MHHNHNNFGAPNVHGSNHQNINQMLLHMCGLIYLFIYFFFLRKMCGLILIRKTKFMYLLLGLLRDQKQNY